MLLVNGLVMAPRMLTLVADATVELTTESSLAPDEAQAARVIHPVRW